MLITEKIKEVANAIRSKTGKTDLLKLEDMVDEINNTLFSNVQLTYTNDTVKNFLNKAKNYTSDNREDTSYILDFINPDHKPPVEQEATAPSDWPNKDFSRTYPETINFSILDNNLDETFYIDYYKLFQPNCFLRQIQCQTRNVRDLGGWTCDGGTIKYGKLFRGGSFNNEDKGIFYNQLKITSEIDLRADNENGVNNISSSPINSNIKYYRKACTSYLINKNINNNKDIVKEIITDINNDKNIYFHCSAGADRTGTIAFLIEAILGVAEGDMDKDYELSTFYTENISSSKDQQYNDRYKERTQQRWKNFIDDIRGSNSTDSIRDCVIKWYITENGSVDTDKLNEINVFRGKMINGNPKTLGINENNNNIQEIEN